MKWPEIPTEDVDLSVVAEFFSGNEIADRLDLMVRMGAIERPVARALARRMGVEMDSPDRRLR